MYLLLDQNIVIFIVKKKGGGGLQWRVTVDLFLLDNNNFL